MALLTAPHAVVEVPLQQKKYIFQDFEDRSSISVSLLMSVNITGNTAARFNKTNYGLQSLEFYSVPQEQSWAVK